MATSFVNTREMRAILKSTFIRFGQDDVLRLSAALAYYAMVSIGPLLAIVVASVAGLAGLAFGNEHVRQLIHQILQDMYGARAALTLDSMLAAQRAGGSLIASIIGFIVPLVVLLFGAAGVFGQLQLALNRIWEVKKPNRGAGTWAFIRQRFLSLATVLGLGFLLLISLALSAVLAVLTGTLDQLLPGAQLLAHAFNFVVSLGVVTLLFALIFKFLPEVKIRWSKVWFGAIVTALLFFFGKFLLEFYVGRQMAAAYGTAASVIAVLLWIYYASVILLLGAEFTHVYAKQTEAGLMPSK